MTFTFRRALVAGVLSAATIGTFLTGPASADDSVPSPECVRATAEASSAQTVFDAARDAFVATRKPLGTRLAAERKAARTEIRTSRIALRELRRQGATTHDNGARQILRAQMRVERADIRHSRRLLESKAALRAQVRADRRAARAAFAEARSELKTAERAADAACSDTAPAEPVV